MHDFTNMAWPETPFGADQRPFGAKAHMVAGFGVEWDPVAFAEGRQLPVCVSTVYLRVKLARALPVTPETLSYGFRVSVASGPEDVDSLIGVLDRALVRAHRHATVLAGHALGSDLGHLVTATDRARPGVVAVGRAWAAKSKVRGMARIVDTCGHVDADRFDIDPSAPAGLDGTPSEIAARSLERCLGIALAGASRQGLLTWQGRFTTRDAVARAGWDVLGLAPTPTPTPTPSPSPSPVS